MLKTWEHLRDDDFKLIASYWKFEAENKQLDLDKMSANDFLKMFAEGRLTHSESVRRVRAKLQEENPALRGKSYGRRQSDGEDFKNNINP